MDHNEVVQTVRACLLSAKGGVKFDDLNPDYRMIIGENIPYRRLGHPTLEAFLRTIPGIRISNKGGVFYAEAQPTEDTVHITKLISRQKTPKKSAKSGKSSRYFAPFQQPNRAPTRSVRITKGFKDSYSSVMSKPVPPLMQRDSMDFRRGKENGALPVTTYSVKSTVAQTERPRYIQPAGITSSPSKRLKNKDQSLPPSPTNHSSSTKVYPAPAKLNDGDKAPVATSVINQKPKTAQANTIVYRGKADINERLKINPHVSPHTAVQNNYPPADPSYARNVPSASPIPPLMAGSLPASMANASKNAAAIVGQPNLSGRSLESRLTAPTAQISSFQTNDSHERTVPKLLDTQDPREQLKLRAKNLGLQEPVYKILPTRNKNTNDAAVYAKVKVGTYEASSFPAEAKSADEAEILAARLALNDLIENFGSAGDYPTTTDDDVIRSRVLALVDQYEYGVFMHQVLLCYMHTHKEKLPDNWMKVIEKHPEISLEKGADNSIILHRYVPTTPKPSEVSLPKVDKIQLNPIGPVAPERLEPPNEDFWLVYVTLVGGTTDIWVKLIGENYSDKFDEMTRQMADFYGKDSVQPATAQSVTVGHYYTLFDDDFWHRVHCVDFDPAIGNATVSFIDYGDEDTFHFSKLYALDRKFCSVPAQALRLCMDGLEVFDDCDKVVARATALLCDLSFYVEVVNYDSNEQDPHATVVFYDSRGPEDVNINKLLMKEILRDIARPPKLDVVGLVTKVFISHVEANGDVFVQVQSESMTYLVKLLNRLISTKLNPNDVSRSIVLVIDTAKLFFVHAEGGWYRGKVIQIVGNKVKMYLIDFGKTVTVGKASLLHLELLSPILTKYPAQALKVHLHNVESSMFNDKMVAKLNDLAPRGEPLLAKIVIPGKETMATLELFKRIQPSNMLVSINTTLLYEEKLTGTNGDGNNNTVKPRKRLDRVTSRTSVGDENELLKALKPPTIPGIGKYFDVHVTMAANPGNFTVQPFDDKLALEEMMIRLQNTCKKYDGPQPSPESVKESQLYAGEHTDGHWYRVYVSNVISDNLVSVYFCDYGDVSVLTLSKLQPLQKQFLELPYQAIRAKIIGIQPANIDWSVEDCIRFQELVVNRDFVSIVLEYGSDKLSPVETMLGVRLIGVDTAEDIYIDRILVDEGRAKRTRTSE